MSYQSIYFIVFSFLVLIVYYAVPLKFQKVILLLGNTAFFLIMSPKSLPFILITTISSFFFAKKIGLLYEKEELLLNTAKDITEKKQIKSTHKKQAKLYLIIDFIIVIGLLAVCKYTLFATTNINSILAKFSQSQISIKEIILPIGISFYTFMALSYILDIFWKRYKYEKNFWLYALYASYFPHVVQGPIDRYNSFKEQINNGNGINLSYKNITYGAQLALWGFFKKLVIANSLGLFVDSIYDYWQTASGAELIISTAAYSIQIYCDFSGCIDIISGISEMLGIKLSQNFNHPYFSRSMPEFWRRWHISLGDWFKDYVYFPVSTSQLVKNVKKKYKNTSKKKIGEHFASCYPALIVWIITGIWHGAAWKYVAWGLFHATLIILNNIFQDSMQKINIKLHIPTEKFIWKLWQMLRTFFFCCVGRVFFRAASLKVALEIFKKTVKLPLNLKEFFYNLLDASITLERYNINQKQLLATCIAILILLIGDILQEKKCVRDMLAQTNIVVRWCFLLVAVFVVIIFGTYGPTYNAADFIYGQF